MKQDDGGKMTRPAISTRDLIRQMYGNASGSETL